MCKEEEGLSIKWIFNRTNKFQFVGMIKIPISRVKGLVINMNVGNRLLLVKYKERRKMELSENMLGNGRYVVKFGG